MSERLSVVISAYNEEGNVKELHRRLDAALAPLSIGEVEIIFVDDGSTDSTLLRCRELQRQDPRVKIVRMFRNFGHETAMLAGMHHATGDAVIFMDGDLQHPPEKVPDMIRFWREGHEIVLTKRTDNADTGWLYNLCSHIFYRVLNFLSDTQIPANAPDFRLLSRRYIDILKSFDERGIMMRGMICLVTPLDQAAVVEFSAPGRLSGETKYNFRKNIGLALDSIMQFSVKPLFLSLWLALITTVLAVVLGVQVFVERYVLQNPTPGFATIVLTTLVMGTVNLVVLTIIGAYVAKIHIETKKRPSYLAEFIAEDSPRPGVADKTGQSESTELLSESPETAPKGSA